MMQHKTILVVATALTILVTTTPAQEPQATPDTPEAPLKWKSIAYVPDCVDLLDRVESLKLMRVSYLMDGGSLTYEFATGGPDRFKVLLPCPTITVDKTRTLVVLLAEKKYGEIRQGTDLESKFLKLLDECDLSDLPADEAQKLCDEIHPQLALDLLKSTLATRQPLKACGSKALKSASQIIIKQKTKASSHRS